MVEHELLCYDSINIPEKKPYTYYLWGFKVVEKEDGLHKISISYSENGLFRSFEEVKHLPKRGQFSVKYGKYLKFNKADAGELVTFSWRREIEVFPEDMPQNSTYEVPQRRSSMTNVQGTYSYSEGDPVTTSGQGSLTERPTISAGTAVIKVECCSSCGISTTNYVKYSSDSRMCSNCFIKLVQEKNLKIEELKSESARKDFVLKVLTEDKEMSENNNGEIFYKTCEQFGCKTEFVTTDPDRKFCSVSCKEKYIISNKKYEYGKKLGTEFFEKYKPRKATKEEYLDFLKAISKKSPNYNYDPYKKIVKNTGYLLSRRYDDSTRYYYENNYYLQRSDLCYVIEGDVDIVAGVTYHFPEQSIDFFVIKNGRVNTIHGKGNDKRNLEYYCLDSDETNISTVFCNLKELPDTPQKRIIQEMEKENDTDVVYLPPFFNIHLPTDIENSDSLHTLVRRLHNKNILKYSKLNMSENFDLFCSETLIDKIHKSLDNIKQYKKTL